LPLAAPHHRRDGLVFGRPSSQGKQSWPSPDGGQGNQRMSYEQSFSVANSEAVTVGSRVAGLVTNGPTMMRSVAASICA